MRQNLFLFILLLLIPTYAAAQSGRLTVKVSDAEVSTLPVAGAIVEITPTANPAGKLYYSTDGTGGVTISALQYGDYSLSVSFLGYETAIVPFSMASEELTLPEIKLASSSVQMETVIKTTKALRASQKGDTLSYSASAFKVSSDADVEGLLEKMPGIAIEDGTVTAQGEEIKKIYVDGREFFGSDIATALKSLPAEVVARIEVYDKLSDSAEASGVDDGEGEKAINIVTHENMRKGIFGKMFVGGGYEPNPYEFPADNYVSSNGQPSEYGDLTKGKYMSGGSVNLFHDTSRISVIGLANNVNQQNFSFEDIMGVTDDSNSSANSFMVKQLPGVAVVQAVGVNYSDVFGKDDKLKVQASYFYNETLTTNEETLKRWYDESYSDDVVIIDSLEQTTYKVTKNVNHRLNGRFDWKINKKTSIMFRPSLSLQVNDPISTTYGMRYDDSQSDESSYTAYNRFDIYGNRLHGQQAYANENDSRWAGYNAGLSVHANRNLGVDRNLSVNGGVTYNKYDSETAYNNIMYWDWEDDSGVVNKYKDYYTYTDSPSFRRNMNGSVNYSEKIVDNWQLNTNYRITQNYQRTDKEVYETDEEYDITTGERIESSSNISESTYTTHRIGSGIRFHKGKTNVIASIYYQRSGMYNETSLIDDDTQEREYTFVDKHYDNLVYTMFGQANFNSENSLKISIYSYTSNPSIWRLQDVLNNPSSDYITKGNSDLNPAYTNYVRLRYIRSNLEKATTLMWAVSATLTNNYTATHIVTQPNDFTFDGYDISGIDQYTTWVNMDGNWKFFTKISYGMPLDFMKCNLNFYVGLNYTIEPSIFGGEVESGTGKIINGYENSTDNLKYNAGLTLGSNISEDLDFTLKWYGSYNETTNIAASDTYIENKNRYYDQTATLNIKYVFLGGFTFTGNVTYKQYFGFTNPYNVQYTLCNAYIGHKVFKNRRGEISIGINDALDQNTSFWRSIGSNYTQNTENITMGRYYSAQFIYNIRYFGKGGSKNMDDYKGMKDYIDGKPSKAKRGDA